MRQSSHFSIINSKNIPQSKQVMEGKKRPTFDQEWWTKVEEHLEEYPEEGFSSSEVKQFIKFCVNKHIESQKIENKELENLVDEMIERKLD